MSIPSFLKKHKNKILRCDFDSCASEFKISVWEKHIPGDKVLQKLMQECRKKGQGDDKRKISRRDVFNMVQGKIDDRKNRKIFLASMLWGYGTVGYGSHRTKQMVSADNFNKSIRRAYALTAGDDVEAAYKWLVSDDGKLPKFGPVFLTKYLYFIGKNCRVKPLVLDLIIAQKLETLCKCDIKKYARVSRKAGEITQIASPYAKGYMQYIADMNDWAEQLGATPGQVEHFLFYF